MQISASVLPSNAEIESDVCIVGSGAGGLALAYELQGAAMRICILESGTVAPAKKQDELYEFEATGLPIAHESRARTLGGTTAVWAGRWKALDPIDFSRRPWIPHSGWPISFEDLLPYYERAATFARLKKHPLPLGALFPTSDSLEPILFRFQDRGLRRWGSAYATALARKNNVRIITDAHVQRLETSGKQAQFVHARRPDGSPFKIQARYIVLATGGIETPRLLLLSDIGNETDQVGRFYMDHPKGACGVVEAYRSLPLSDSAFFDAPGAPSFGLRMSDAFQKRHEILNSNIYLEPLSDRTLRGRVEGMLPFSDTRSSPVAVIRNYLEQAPHPENRVTLGSSLDLFGNKKASVAWNIGALDEKTAHTFHTLLSLELPRRGIGEVKSPLLEKPDVFPITQDASHHMGTTRMGADPASSVVDPDCRVHGTNNLFIAGSSVFPTGGAAGPTATIAALSIRLADHLKSLV